MLKMRPQSAPALRVDPAQLAPGRGTKARRGGGDQPNRTPQHRTGRGGLAPGGATLVIALRPKQLLQPIVGARQVGHRFGVEQPGPVAARHFAKVINGSSQHANPVAVPLHGAKQTSTAPPHPLGAVAVRVAEHVGCRMHPGISALHSRPKRCCALKTAPDHLAQSRERRRCPPFCLTRSRLPATFSSRFFNMRPEAASGARPSSVMALRTAAQ